MTPTWWKIRMGLVAWFAHLAVFGWILTGVGLCPRRGNLRHPVDRAGTRNGGKRAEKGSGVTPLVAPLPFKNSQIGWGVALMLGLIHRLDADTTVKPSTGAIVGLASENGSWGVMANGDGPLL